LNNINLIPNRILKKNIIIATTFLKSIIIFVLSLVVILSLFLKTYQRIKLEGRVNMLRSKTDYDKIKALNETDITLDKISDELQYYIDLKAAIESMENNNVGIVNTVVSNAVPGIEIQRVGFDKIKHEIVLGSTAEHRSDIAAFITKLDEEELCDEVIINGISGNENKYSFNVVIKLLND